MFIDCSYIFDTARKIYSGFSYNHKYGKAIIPLRYFLDITYRCNLKCSYCYLGEERKKDELTTDDWRNVIRQIPKYGFIAIIGGEPLYRKDFKEIYAAASERTCGKVNVCSNALLIDEEIINTFIKYKLLSFSFSLDGYGKTHDINRGLDGAFDKVIENIDLLQSKTKNKHKILLDLKTILLENNLEDLVSLYELASQKKYDFVSISLKRNNLLKQNPYLRNELSEEFYLREYPIEPYFDMERFKEIFNELLKIQKHSKTKLRFAPKFKPNKDGLKQIEYLYKHGKEPVTELYKECYIPFSTVYVNPEGFIYPCLSVSMGNIKEKTLMEIFNQPKYCCFRKNLKASKVFTACQLCCEAYLKNKEE